MTAQPYIPRHRVSLTSGFWSELRRRKVYRVAAAYVMAGGFIVQMASAVFPAWDLPLWNLRLLIAATLAGFPIALIFAWAFDVTPAGLERTPPARAPGRTGLAYRQRNIILLSSLGLAASIVAGFFLWPRDPASAPPKSVAVLPFENLSSDPEDAYFAAGIQDDIRSALAKVSDLKVVSRTSVMPFRGKTKNVREIGKVLGVAAVVEGTVRRSGNRVRVNVQLINAVNDRHIWSQEYDRDLYDMIALQSELAQKISDELHARLSPAEKAQLERRPTENADAYVAYVQARHLQNNWENFEKLQQAETVVRTRVAAGSQLRPGPGAFFQSAELDLPRARCNPSAPGTGAGTGRPRARRPTRPARSASGPRLLPLLRQHGVRGGLAGIRVGAARPA